MPGWWRCVLVGGVTAVVTAIVGCHGLSGSRLAVAPAPGSQPTSAPSTRPAPSGGYDPAKALLPLESIPPAFTMPAGTEKPDREIPPQAIKHYLAARDLYNQWMNTDAIEELEKALRYDPGSFECHLLLGRAAVRAGNLGQARNHLREAVKLRPDDVACEYLLGWLAAAAKDPAEAVQRLRAALMCSNAAPDRAETLLAHYCLAEELMVQGYLSAGIREFEAFEQGISDPRGVFWQSRELQTVVRTRRIRPPLMIGQASLELRRYGQAAEAFGRALKLDPNDLQLKARHAQALARSGRRDEALTVARGLALTTNQSQAGVELMGWIYKDSGQPRQLVVELEKLLSEHPSRGDFGILLAETLIGMGQKDQAEQIFRRLIKEDPKYAVAYERLALMLVDQGRLAEALRVLADGLDAGSEGHLRMFRVAGVLASQTKLASQVVAQADALMAANPKNHALSYVIGLIAYGSDRKDLAVRCFERSIEAKPDFLPGHLSLGRLYLDRFEWQRAIEVAQRASKAGQRNAGVSYLLARGYDGLDEIDRAEAAYQEVIKADPKSVGAMVALGEMYERVGQRNKAQREYQRVLKIAPGNDQAGERLIRLLLSEGDANQAREELERLRRGGGSGPSLGRCLAVMASRGDMERYRKLLNDILSEVPKDADTRYDLATSYYATKDYDKASEQVDQILKLSPGHHRARFLMAELCRKRLDFEGAGKVVSGLLREHPNREVWLLALVEVYLDLQDYDHALGLLERLARQATDGARRRLYQIRLIGAYTAARQYDRAATVAEQWLKDDPSSVTGRRALIEALQEGGKHDRAIVLAKQWLAAGPSRPAKKDREKEEEEEGEALDAVKNEGDGEEKGEEKRSEDPRHAGRGLLISACLRARQYDQALETLTSWMQEDPSNRWLANQMWLVLTTAKRHEDAIQWCRATLASARQLQATQLMLAQSYLKAARYDDALAVLSGIAQGERNEQADVLEVEVLVAARRFEQAERRAKEIVSHNTDEQARLAYTRLLLVPVYHRTGRIELAEKEMEKIYAKQAKDPGINNDLGYTWADAGHRLDQAERMLRFALGEEPRSSAYMDSMGWVLYKKGDFKGAAHYLIMAVKAQGGRDPVIFEHLGDTSWRLGDKSAAVRSWKQAVEQCLKDQADEKEPADPQTLTRVRAKLADVERGGQPAVAATAAGTSSTSRAQGE
jgi:tetratricopeptide (TPR) repeat protein